MTLHLLSSILLVLLVCVMFGLGLTLTVDDFKRLLSTKKAIALGLLIQTVLLPGVALSICYLFKIDPIFSVGFMILAASPGGPSSILYSHLAGGDVALNLTLTALNSLTSILSLPGYTILALFLFRDEAEPLSIHFAHFIEVFLLIVIPTIFGMWVRSRSLSLAHRLEKPFKLGSFLILILVVAATIFREWNLVGSNIFSLGPAVLAFNLFSLGLGYFIPLNLGLSRKQATAMTFEVGVHNGTLALFVALNVLQNTSYSIPAVLYSVMMYFTAGALCFLLRR